MTNEIYMQRAIELASLGAGSVSPNPMVGCVIVNNGFIIGEGWHQKIGGPHAEVNALNSIQDKNLLEGAEVYVTLEPCSHFGKTPPCADALIQYPIKKVYIGCLDPNPLVAGKGIEKLIQAGIEVEVGLMEDECCWMNRRFLTFQKKKRPYIILKWAETSDGFIAREDYNSKWISNIISRTLVHRWRTEEDAILVGTNTVLFDNPRLNVRHWKGKNPLRLFIDKNLQVPQGAHILDGTQPTVCYNYQKEAVINMVEYKKFDPSLDFLDQLLEDLFLRKTTSLIVEGGTHLLNTFIQRKLWDEARIFTSPLLFENGISAPNLKSKILSREKLEDDELTILVNTQS